MGLTVAEAEEHGRKPGGPAPVQKCGHGGIRYLTWETCWVHEGEWERTPACGSGCWGTGHTRSPMIRSGLTTEVTRVGNSCYLQSPRSLKSMLASHHVCQYTRSRKSTTASLAFLVPSERSQWHWGFPYLATPVTSSRKLLWPLQHTSFLTFQKVCLLGVKSTAWHWTWSHQIVLQNVPPWP